MERMTVERWRCNAKEELKKAGDLDAEWDADWMLCDALQCGRAQLRWMGEGYLSGDILKRLDDWLTARVSGRPLQYVLGSSCFMGLTFRCDERALIPRQDTETLVELALRRMQTKKEPKVLDLCTGSGAVGLAVKYYRSDAQVTLTDISRDALSLARENAALHGLDVRVRQGDLLEATFGERFDFILSNPPYLTEQDMRELQAEVRCEPELALRGGEDGLDFYRRIAGGLSLALRDDGELLVEIGKGQETSVVALLNEQGFEAQVHMDLCGINRVVNARRAGK